MVKYLLLLMSLPALGQVRYLEADRVFLEGSRIDALRDAYMPEFNTGTAGESWAYGMAAGFDLCLFCIDKYEMFWRNNVHGRGTDNQVRYVGWWWEAGVTIVPDKVEIFHRHHSEHCLECQNNSQFPLLDEYVLRFNLYTRDK